MEEQKIQTNSLITDKIVKGPKALFWYFALFFTLGITAFSTGGLWFQFINKWFPREIRFDRVVSSFSQSALKWQMAALIVSVPVFFIFSLLIRKAFKKSELSANNKVRLWITYIILFLVVAIAVGDLIATTFSLLSGDFTARFLLKSLTILIIVSWVFIYYWLELRSPTTLTDSRIPRLMGGISLALIIISFAGTFFIIESPAEARRKAYDRTRVNNLQEIKYSVDNYYREHEKIPASLEDLKSFRRQIKIIDPKTEKFYEYRIINETSYELCAEFETSNKDEEEDYYYKYPYDGFIHEAGRNCFDRKASLSEIELEKSLTPLPID